MVVPYTPHSLLTSNHCTPIQQRYTIWGIQTQVYSLGIHSGVYSMDFEKFLIDSGWTRAEVARKLGLSRGALTKWEEVPERWVPSLEGVLRSSEAAPKPVKRIDPKDISDLELLKIIRGRSKTTDFDICQEHGWRIHEFNKMIADLVAKYAIGDDFWGSA